MQNKEMKKPIPMELDDDVLDNVSGGVLLWNPIAAPPTIPSGSADSNTVQNEDI